jgi:uncharacterized protein
MKAAVEKKEKRHLALHWKILLFVVLSVAGTAFVGLFHDGKPASIKPEPTENFYINDYSHVYSEETEAFFWEQGRKLAGQTSAQVVVAAVPDTEYESFEKYSRDMARRWELGDPKKANGVLILFATGENTRVRMEVGYGLKELLTQSVCSEILEQWAEPAMQEGNWNQAALQTWVTVAKKVYTEYGKEIPEALISMPQANETPGASGDADADLIPAGSVMQPWLVLLVNFGIFWAVVLALMLIGLLFKAIFRWNGWGSSAPNQGGAAWVSYGPHDYGGSGVGGSSSGGGGFGGNGTSG